MPSPLDAVPSAGFAGGEDDELGAAQVEGGDFEGGEDAVGLVAVGGRAGWIGSG